MAESIPGGGWKIAGAGAVALLGWKAFQRAREVDLAGQTVLIAGGSRGLGLLLAREFARNGCRVAICARDDKELEIAREDLERRGADVLAVPCDVSDRAQVEQLVQRVTDHFGSVDVLVNNAAIMQVGPVEAMTLEEIERAMAINFWGAAYATFAVLPQMRARQGGRIVNITSIGGKVSLPHMLPYCCGKFALVGLSEGLRAEVRKEGISVTTIVPGLMRTGSQTNAFYSGNAEAEWNWFTWSGTTPLTSMDAERAARRIVQAARRGEAEVTLTWQAKLLARTHGLAPGLTASMLGVVNRALPDADPTQAGEVRGMELATAAAPSPVTGMMTDAAKHFNEYGGTPTPSPEHAQDAGLAR